MIVGLFETIQTTNQPLTNNMIKLFNQYGLKKKSLFMSKMKGQITYTKICFNQNTLENKGVVERQNP
jgi:hypothetical protein